jgi:uncharacterized membrane protein
MTGLAYGATLATAVGAGAGGGVFFAFSSFVMPALRRLPAGQGTAAMQSINERAVTPPFMVALFGTAAGCAGLAVWAALADDAPRGWLIGGSAAYLLGTIGVTIAGNVPLNDRLAAVEPAATDTAAWHGWVSRWTALNHVRTVAALAACGAFAVALERA